MKTIDFTDDDQVAMDKILTDLDRTVVLNAPEDADFEVVIGKFKDAKKKLEKNGPTAKLWIQYFEMITLVKQFIEAERMGNWKLHLDTIKKMLPYFHASGHFLYAKSAQLYLQDMENLKEKMTPREYHRFTTAGYFTIRRSEKFWSGIFSDMTIEQTLIRLMKICGGLTHGRGYTDSVIALWILGMASMHNVCYEMEKFCGVLLEMSEQHVDMRLSRIARDNADVEKLISWFSQYTPFPNINEIMSISTGIVGDEKINCHMSREIGNNGLSRIIGENFDSVKFKRKDKVLPLATISNSIKVDTLSVPINPLLLFQRMCVTKQSDEQLKEYLSYELAPFPMSIFTEEGMRKGTKSSLYSAFAPLPDDTPLGSHIIHVVDGDYLLHKVVWNHGINFESICMRYIEYVRQHHGQNTIIVFDGYPENATEKCTKSAERQRRSRNVQSADIIFIETTFPTASQEKFLANESNKRRFISMLMRKFQQYNFAVRQATEDADVLIINTALEMSSTYQSVIVVGEDIDLLVLLTSLAKSDQNIYFSKPAKGRNPGQLFSPQSFKYKAAVADHILFIHAFSGCDTTSAIFGIGKIKFITTLQNNKQLVDVLRIFKEQDADLEKVASAGERFLIHLYGGDASKDTLHTLRYLRFTRSIIKIKFNLASLPPTKEAAREHSLRTYHQVQAWSGIEKNPHHFGWQRSKNELVPIKSTRDPAPPALLQLISCKCKTKCRAACGCRKAGLKCSIICQHCSGQTCDNISNLRDGIEEDEINDDEIQTGVDHASIFCEFILHETEKEVHEDIYNEEFNDEQPGPSKRIRLE